MTDRQLRARLLLAEAESLGISLTDLIAAGQQQLTEAPTLSEFVDAVRTTSRDHGLDLLLVRFHLETGARRQGALNLRLRDIDPHRSTVWLREKDTEREQPTSPSLITLLRCHATSRGGTHPSDQVFRRSAGAPITRRRYNTLFDAAHLCLPWAARTPVSAHALRHTAITNVARLAGYPVAQTFAGHTPPSITRHLHPRHAHRGRLSHCHPHRRTPPVRARVCRSHRRDAVHPPLAHACSAMAERRTP